MNGEIDLKHLEVARLGSCRYTSPLNLSTEMHDGLGDFVFDDRRVRYSVEFDIDGPQEEPPGEVLAFEKAGPRQNIFFDPPKTTAAIVTCGGLCPGINNVIRSAYFELAHNYRVARVLGMRNGYAGLNPASGLPPLQFTDEVVEEIHKLGGTLLGTSRGPQDSAVVADFLVEQQIDALFCIGGDGTQRGAHAIDAELRRRQLPISVVGIPKTIDNDITYVDRTFGFLTALEEAQQVLRGAHVEAKAALRGIGLVKLMGRNAGFIAAGAALASQEADFVLVPEVAFPLEGPEGLLPVLEQRMQRRGHAVIVAAEGAGQHLLDDQQRKRDASGNVKHADIGEMLRSTIIDYFSARKSPVSLKYIDPSYTIRSVPANCGDRLLCDQLARRAVHAAMAGKTGVMIGMRHGAFIHVPITAVNAQTKQMDVEGDLWTNVLLVTGQPRWR